MYSIGNLEEAPGQETGLGLDSQLIIAVLIICSRRKKDEESMWVYPSGHGHGHEHGRQQEAIDNSTCHRDGRRMCGRGAAGAGAGAGDASAKSRKEDGTDRNIANCTSDCKQTGNWGLETADRGLEPPRCSGGIMATSR